MSPRTAEAETLGLMRELLKPGSAWHAYENSEIGHPDAGHLRFLQVGPECQYKEPPARLPDTPTAIGWRYLPVGVVNMETGAVEQHTASDAPVVRPAGAITGFVVFGESPQGKMQAYTTDPDCHGALVPAPPDSTPYLFSDMKAAYTAIDVSAANARLRKVRGEAFLAEFLAPKKHAMRPVVCIRTQASADIPDTAPKTEGVEQ